MSLMTGESMERITSIDVMEEAAALAVPFPIELRTRRGVVIAEVDPMGWEAIDYEFRKLNPKPKPTCSRELVKDETILRQLGETKPVVIRTYDPQDDAYLIRFEEWKDAQAFAVVSACLKLELRNGSEVITDPAGRIQALKTMGMTASLAWQLFQLIQKRSLAQEAAIVDFSEAPSDPMGGAGS